VLTRWRGNVALVRQTRLRHFCLGLVSLAACAGNRAATYPALPLDTADEFPVLLEAREVSRDEFASLLNDTVAGLPEEEVIKATQAVFKGPANSTTAFVHHSWRFAAIVHFDGYLHHGLVLRTTRQGFPVLPLERLLAAVSLKGLGVEAQREFSLKLAQCLASNGKCSALAVFSNGNAVAPTVSIARDNPTFLEVTSRFLRKDTYQESDYAIITRGAESVSSTGTSKVGEVTRVPILNIPRAEKTIPKQSLQDI